MIAWLVIGIVIAIWFRIGWYIETREEKNEIAEMNFIDNNEYKNFIKSSKYKAIMSIEVTYDYDG